MSNEAKPYSVEEMSQTFCGQHSILSGEDEDRLLATAERAALADDWRTRFEEVAADRIRIMAERDEALGLLREARLKNEALEEAALLKAAAAKVLATLGPVDGYDGEAFRALDGLRKALEEMP